MKRIPSSEITPEAVYLGRRSWLKQAGALALGAAALAACGASEGTGATDTAAPAADVQTPLDTATNYNNYYEFSTDKESVAGLSRAFRPTPWAVEVTGLVNKPTTFALEDLTKQFPVEERVYRLRCVGGWSMVLPWMGFPLASLLKAVEPTSAAKYVRFISVERPSEMPGQKSGFYSWPYVEGLRLDEAMNPLALMVTGLYGAPLPNQNGAPLRLAVPWKYGFKSAKAIVKIELVAAQPTSLWMDAAAEEYGFYANVNPDVSHPRWSQTSERRIGESGRRRTLPFNGYAAEVASLYTGMDLAKFY